MSRVSESFPGEVSECRAVSSSIRNQKSDQDIQTSLLSPLSQKGINGRNLLCPLPVADGQSQLVAKYVQVAVFGIGDKSAFFIPVCVERADGRILYQYR